MGTSLDLTLPPVRPPLMERAWELVSRLAQARSIFLLQVSEMVWEGGGWGWGEVEQGDSRMEREGVRRRGRRREEDIRKGRRKERFILTLCGYREHQTAFPKAAAPSLVS